jgi:hypothetical protein
MKYTYEIINNDNARPVIKRVDEDGNEAWIPTNPANSDYAAYLATLVTESAPTA